MAMQMNGSNIEIGSFTLLKVVEKIEIRKTIKKLLVEDLVLRVGTHHGAAP